MQIAWSKPLFAWEQLEDCPSLHTLRELLAVIPDGPLLFRGFKHCWERNRFARSLARRLRS